MSRSPFFLSPFFGRAGPRTLTMEKPFSVLLHPFVPAQVRGIPEGVRTIDGVGVGTPVGCPFPSIH